MTPPAVTLVACIGGGQLGRMLGLAGLPLGLSFRFLDPAADACAGAVGELVVAEYGDREALARLADGAAVVTYEFENVPVEAAAGVGAVPGVAALERGQDRLHEKELFRSLGIPTARFGDLEATGLPALVKTRRLGYDGKGQRRVEAIEPLARGRAGRGARPVRPRAVDRRRPRARRRDALLAAGRERPPRRHPRASPARPPRMRRRRRRRRSARRCSTRSTTSACSPSSSSRSAGGCSRTSSRLACTTPATGRSTAPSTSQFENHLRAILGLPLGATEATGRSVMVNLVGAVAAARRARRACPARTCTSTGRSHAPGARSGHVTLVDPDEETVERAIALARGGLARRRGRARCGGARAGARGSTPRGGAGRRRACSARSSRRRRGRASPGRCAGRRRPRAGGWRTSGAGGAGGRAPARGPARSARRRRMRNAPARVSAPPRAFRKRSGRWRRSRCGRPSAR